MDLLPHTSLNEDYAHCSGDVQDSTVIHSGYILGIRTQSMQCAARGESNVTVQAKDEFRLPPHLLRLAVHES
jgi:hypothetical protein